MHFYKKKLDILDKVISAIYTMVDAAKPKYIVLLGDMMHTHDITNLSTWQKCIRFMKVLSKKCERLFVLLGNHDRKSHINIDPSEHWFELVNFATIVSKPVGIENMLFLPYMAKGTLHSTLKEMNIDPNSYKYVFAHQDFRGGMMTRNISCNDGDIWPLDFPRLYSGHYHDHHIVADNLIYVGTPYQTNVAESTKKYLCLIEGDQYTMLRVRNIPLYIDKYVNDEELNELEFDDNNFYRIFITTRNKDILLSVSQRPNVKYILKYKVSTSSTNRSSNRKNRSLIELLDRHLKGTDMYDLYKAMVSQAV